MMVLGNRSIRARLAILAGVLGVAALAFAFAPRMEARPPAKGGKAPRTKVVERGKYMVTILGCNDCHTPFKIGDKGIPEPDMTRMLSGHPEGLKLPPPPKPEGPWIWYGTATNTAYAGPWGVTYAINLTPDQNTGLGSWTEEIFVKAMKTGRHFGTSRTIQPPMPWQWYRFVADSDLKAIYAYLRSIPPISNRVPDYEEPKAAAPAP